MAIGQQVLPGANTPGHGRQDDVFCPESISGQLLEAAKGLFGTARKQSPHSAQVVLIGVENQLRPALDRTNFGVGISAIVCFQLFSAAAF